MTSAIHHVQVGMAMLKAISDDDPGGLARWLERVPSPNHQVDTDGRMYPLLARACEIHSEQCRDLLLEAGADPNLADSHGDTPLHHISSVWSSKTISPGIRTLHALVAHGADLNRGDSLGRSPLHVAVQDSLPEMVTAMLALGADHRKRCNMGAEPWQDSQTFDNSCAGIACLRGGARPFLNPRDIAQWDTSRHARQVREQMESLISEDARVPGHLVEWLVEVLTANDTRSTWAASQLARVKPNDIDKV